MQSKTIAAPHVPVRYFEGGKGEPLVFLHGASGITLADLARDLGCTAPALNVRFGSRIGLLKAYYAWATQMDSERFRRVRDEFTSPIAAVRARRQLQTERNFRQAELLLQSGVERAVYRLSAEKDYRGEAWEPASQALAGPGRVVIQTQPAADNGPLQINVVAEYPVGSPLSIRRSYSFQFTPSHSRVEE